MSCARICTWIMSAGIRNCATDVGYQRSPMPPMSFHVRNGSTGRRYTTPLEHLADSVLPVVEAGLVTFVANDYALNDEVWLEPTPGHTPDHVSVHLASNGAHAVITGDMIHSPVQCAEPSWIPRPDFDRALAHQTRQAFLERYCETDVLICGTHFPSPSMGHIVPHGNAFQFAYEQEDN